MQVRLQDCQFSHDDVPLFTSEKAEEISKRRTEMSQQGYALPPEKAPAEKFDSNCITPVSIVKFLNFRTRENFVVINLKFKQRG